MNYISKIQLPQEAEPHFVKDLEARQEIQEILESPGLAGTVASVESGIGLKVTGDPQVNPKVEIDDEVVFIWDCGTSTEII